MGVEAIVDIALVLVFIVATVIYLKFGGKEYTYNNKGELVPYEEPAAADAGAAPGAAEGPATAGAGDAAPGAGSAAGPAAVVGAAGDKAGVV